MPQAENFIFSLTTMMASNGSAKADADYLSAFLQECERRFTTAAAAIKGVADGAPRMSSSTHDEVRAHLAEMRRCDAFLAKLAHHFEGKPSIAKTFTDLHGILRKHLKEATQQANAIFDWFA